ncbi:hypothetical protein [Pantoea sp. ACRSB]|uniref:hypothetical protein n=1 Tax=Pantoea sp. ACRSB TaxID=2918207 RepID=UPI002893638A|nr:hypothetical protein [Pantoea sp. ACRSB]MCG7388285.1 hypothetical protein [Pantoea sp. ACRSB]
MPKYKIHFEMVRQMAGGGQGVGSASETVEANSESSAIQIATSKVQAKAIWKGHTAQLKKVESL